MPLEVTLHAMRRAWGIAHEFAEAGNTEREMDYLALAVKHAVEAAPFCHPKLASVALKNDEDAPLQVIIRRIAPDAV